MTNIIIIHGTGGNPESNWFPRLKRELEKLGHQVFVPPFPTPKNQSLKSWLKIFEKYEQYLNEETIVVGHSLGPAFLLSVLEKRHHPIKAAFFVARFTGLLGNPKYDSLNITFTTKDFNWIRIRKKCQRFYVINSDDDPYVPLEKGKDLARSLGTELIVLHNAGHINQDAGYLRFELLLEKIKREL